MKSIILAAGKGSRISDKIGGIPKSTLKLQDGTPLIRREVQMMIDKGMEPIICVGYKKELIKEALKGLDVKYYDNPFYSITNNIVSLWFAKEEFNGEDILLSSADLYYPELFLDYCISNESMLSMTVDSSRIDSGDFYFNVREGRIIEYGPQILFENRSFEYMGLTKIRADLTGFIRDKIEEYISSEWFDRYFEDMIISLNMKENKLIDFIDVSGHFWREFDFYEDYLAILEHERGKDE
mgnify:CR=1 FL=1